jgi:hypothetical protein
MAASDWLSILTSAVAQKASLRLVVTLDGKERIINARPLRLLEGDGAEGIWVQLPEEKPAMLAQLAKAQPKCQASCCINNIRYTFDTSVVRRDPHLWLTDTIVIDSLLLQWPTEIQEQQQRRAERYIISDGTGVSAKLYLPGPPNGTTGKPQLVEVPGKLRDLSMTGACFLSPLNQQLLMLGPGTVMVFVLQFRQKQTTLIAKAAYMSKISNRNIRIGLHFQQRPDAQLQSAATEELQAIIKELQRQLSLRTGKSAA